MTDLNLVFLGVRLAALWLFIASFQVVSMVIAMSFHALRSPYAAPSTWGAVVTVLIFAVVAGVIWRYAASIARRLSLPGTENTTVNINPGGFFRAGCCLIGLQSIVSAIPKLVTISMMRAAYVSDDYTDSLDIAFQVSTPVCEVILGLSLLFFSQKIYSLANSGAAALRA